MNLVIDPDIRTIRIGSDLQEIVIVARTKGEGLRFEWEIDGEGKFYSDKEHSAYTPPSEIKGKSAQITITVTVTDRQEEKATDSVTFTLLAPACNVPDLIGRRLPEAEYLLNQAGLDIGRIFGRGPLVDKQNPASGTPILCGERVDLMLGGVSPCRVPDVIGRRLPEAEYLLNQAGLGIGRIFGRGPLVDKQNPAPGTPILCGERVDLTLGGAPPCTMPDVTGMTPQEAEAYLGELGFDNIETSGGGESVSSQAPAPGTEMPCGERVSLVAVEASPTLSPKILGFGAERLKIEAGQAAVIWWKTENAEEVFLNGTPVELSGKRKVTPTKTTTYELVAVNKVGKDREMITVSAALCMVPDVIKMSVKEAAALLKQAEFDVEISGRGEYVSEQKPVSGAKMPCGKRVSLVVELCMVPDVIKMSVKEAVMKLKQAGFDVKTFEGGEYVSKQNPAPGVLIPCKETVYLTILCTVPNVIKMSLEEAALRLKQAGFDVEISGGGEYVSKQNPAPGVLIPCKEFVYLATLTTEERLQQLKQELVMKEAQRLLKKLGYDPGPEDGLLGPQTITAVKAFQQDRGLVVDGIVTDELLKVLAAAVEAIPPQIIDFGAEPQKIEAGQVATIWWETANADEVFLNGKLVEPSDKQEVSPKETTKYELIAINKEGKDIRTITLYVKIE